MFDSERSAKYLVFNIWSQICLNFSRLVAYIFRFMNRIFILNCQLWFLNGKEFKSKDNSKKFHFNTFLFSTYLVCYTMEELVNAPITTVNYKNLKKQFEILNYLQMFQFRKIAICIHGSWKFEFILYFSSSTYFFFATFTIFRTNVSLIH